MAMIQTEFLGEEKLSGRRVLVMLEIRVNEEGFSESKLYVDVATGLAERREQRWLDPALRRASPAAGAAPAVPGAVPMPKKIRELRSRLKKAGFSLRPGKGSPTVWSHPKLQRRVRDRVRE